MILGVLYDIEYIICCEEKAIVFSQVGNILYFSRRYGNIEVHKDMVRRKGPNMPNFFSGVFFIEIPSTAFFCAGLASLLLALLLAGASVAMCWRWKRIAQTTRAPAPAPAAPVVQPPLEVVKLRQEIFVNEEEFTIMGLDWRWLTDQPANYLCPCCTRAEDLILRLYRHVPSGEVFLIGMHHCGWRDTRSLDTDALALGGL